MTSRPALSRRPSIGGFTIVEMLITISIMLVLASILVPVMGGIRRNAMTMTCLTNEKTIANAMLAYAQANHDFLPVPSVIGEQDPYVCWCLTNGGTADFTHGTLLPYISSSPQTCAKILKCPADNNECLPKVGDSFYPPGNFSYSLNAAIRWSWFYTSQSATGDNPPQSLALHRIKNPSRHGMVFEEFAPNDGLCCGPGDGDDYFTGRHGPYGTADYRDSYYEPNWYNSGRGNVAYFDGHAETIPTSAFQQNLNQIFSPIY